VRERIELPPLEHLIDVSIARLWELENTTLLESDDLFVDFFIIIFMAFLNFSLPSLILNLIQKVRVYRTTYARGAERNKTEHTNLSFDFELQLQPRHDLQPYPAYKPLAVLSNPLISDGTWT
jgi:hypothetical protein